jgi:23S rRNA pseudouridine1911/1915/1917 synthase
MRSPSIFEEDDYSAWEEASLDAGSAAESVEAVELRVAAEDHGVRLDKWLAQQLTAYSRGQLQRWIEEGAVELNGEVATLRQPVRGGDVVRFTPQPLESEMAFTPEAGDVAVLYEDASLFVIDKPAGLVVHPAVGNWGGTLLNRLLYLDAGLAQLPRAGIVHRLDKDTSGLMVVARTAIAQTDLVRQLQARTVRREYLALVHGIPPESGRIDAPVGRHPRERTRMAVFKAGTAHAKPAVTRYEVLERAAAKAPEHGALALVRCQLETGRTHQIRVHMQSIGYPLVGDPVYGLRGGHDPLPRQALHAWRLGLVHPESAEAMNWSAQPPRDFLGLLERWNFDTGALVEGAHDE